MKYLGSERSITQSFSKHGYAEDYSGGHLSILSINGSAKVIKVVNKYKCHEDSINYNDFLNNQKKWKSGNYYNCISITGKTTTFYYDELGGNQVHLETYYNNSKYTLKLKHLASVNVNVGDIVTKDTVIGYQGNTGLVLSSKSKDNPTYGTHVHFEVSDENGKTINPRKFADGSIEYNYASQSNILDDTKRQIQILVKSINIRKEASELSEDLGNVYEGEIYDVLGEVDSAIYTWYKIKTNYNLEGYVASKKDAEWIKLSEPDESIITPDDGGDEVENDPVQEPENNDENVPVTDDKKVLIFECQKDGEYYLNLKKGEKLFLEKN